MKQCLLLNATYEIISFIPEKRAIKLLFKENKVEPISYWDDYIYKNIKNPSILRLKKHVKRNFYTLNFSRKTLINRDKSTCQFCSIKLIASEVTIDHLVPKSQGGGTNFLNCVVSCKNCNNKKGNKTLEESGLKLIKPPIHPKFSPSYNINYNKECWHDDWKNYLI